MAKRRLRIVSLMLSSGGFCSIADLMQMMLNVFTAKLNDAISDIARFKSEYFMTLMINNQVELIFQ